MSKHISIAIDGPSGAGKSTIAKKLAEDLDIAYLDTGAMYRAITFFALDQKIDIKDEEALYKSLDHFQLSMDKDQIFINGKDVHKEIRSKEVTRNVSLVASYPRIRQYLVSLQRKVAEESSAVLDGRDIGSVVLPHASIKFFLTASVEERAKRRFFDSKNKSDQTLEEIQADIEKRDHLDSNRKESPLVQSEDAILIDSSHMSIEEVLAFMKEKIYAL